jgi:hypothetical protein
VAGIGEGVFAELAAGLRADAEAERWDVVVEEVHELVVGYQQQGVRPRRLDHLAEQPEGAGDVGGEALAELGGGSLGIAARHHGVVEVHEVGPLFA